MIRQPNFIRKPEGVGIPVLRRYHYKFDMWWQNKYIKSKELPPHPLNTEKRPYRIVASMTSFPARIHYVEYAIKSLMLQTVKPDRIILWLASEQFPDSKIPESLEKMKEYGLEIRFCDDLKSHKKYYYAMQEQAEDELLITYDDDIIYEYNSIEKLVKTFKKFPDCVICNRAEAFCRDDMGKITPYKSWEVLSNEGVQNPSSMLMPSTGAGCLYPYKILNERVFNREEIEEYAATTDDLWIGFNCLYSNVKIVKTTKYMPTLCTVNSSQTENLCANNVFCELNDRAVRLLSKHLLGEKEQQ